MEPIRDREKIELVKTILKKNSFRDYFLFMIGINTGLRISDILKLKVKDVKDKTHIVMKEIKTGKNKRFKINDTLRDLIEEYTQGMNQEDYLFPSRKGGNKPITRVRAYQILHAAAQKADLEEIGTHTLRKTFGYHFYQQTKDVALLQKLFNHSSPSITLQYIGINQDILDREIDKFTL